MRFVKQGIVVVFAFALLAGIAHQGKYFSANAQSTPSHNPNLQAERTALYHAHQQKVRTLREQQRIETKNSQTKSAAERQAIAARHIEERQALMQSWQDTRQKWRLRKETMLKPTSLALPSQ